LNKFWRPIDKDYFWKKMSWPDVINAVKVSGMGEETYNWCFETMGYKGVKISRAVTRR
jgi:hypothetical protein